MRINKYLAHEGVTTRKGADLLVERGKVKINGRTAKLGDKIEKGDKVEIEEKAKPKAESNLYFAYHKPRGLETSEAGKIKTGKTSAAGVFPVGRLDKDSSGLLIVTNDGRLTDRLLNPKRKHEKEYEVEVDKPVLGHLLKRLEIGVNIEGYHTKKCQAIKSGLKKFRVIITEGKKHQIRRMCAAVGWQVKFLIRTRVVNIELGDLAPGDIRPLSKDERDDLLKTLGLSQK